MCKSKIDGGQRCLGHISQFKEQQQRKADYWQDEVERRAERLEASPSAVNRRNLSIAESALGKAQKKVEGFQQEEETILARRAEKSDEGKTASKDIFLAPDLRTDEWEELDRLAGEGWESRSDLVRTRLLDLPAISKASAEQVGRQKFDGGGNGWGRRPTQGTAGKYLRESRGVRIDEETQERLNEEAAVFGITRSDYVRCLLFKQDPRKVGHHIGDKGAEVLQGNASYREELAGVDGAGAPAYWKGQIKAIRSKYGIHATVTTIGK